jgi:CubicO group peptidase (beta-lactamase class C family)
MKETSMNSTCRAPSLPGLIVSAFSALVVLAPTLASANATLKVVRGSGEFKTLEQAITVSKPEGLDFQWTTDEAKAVGGIWQIIDSSNVMVASGHTTPAPGAGKFGFFTIPANTFLKVNPPATSVKYNVTIRPYDSKNQILGAASVAVVVTQVADTPPPPIKLGPSALFPVLELVHYQEQKGQFQVPVGTLQLRVSTGGQPKTDPMCLSIKDANGLMAEVEPQKIDVMTGTEHKQLPSFLLKAVLPPARSQMGQDQQYAEWKVNYQAQGGVDLRAVMDWCGSPSGGQVPIDGHREVILYRGLGDSTPCEEGKPAAAAPPPDVPICDTKACTSLAEMARRIHQRLNCRVVGYSFFVGRPGTKFEAFGMARTVADPPLSNFKSSTKMTVASASKFITALATIKVLQKHNIPVGSPIGPFLPSDWTITNSIVPAITFQQLLAQTSGIKDYGNHGHDYAAVKAFFTQPVNFFDVEAIKKAPCAKPDITPQYAIVPDNQYCYSNYNTAVLRMLLPVIEQGAAAFKASDPTTLAALPQKFADAYVQIVQSHVFEPLGLKNMDCRPPVGAPYALGYVFPGTTPGYDWTDQRLSCGAQGWYLSVEDYTKVLLSLNANDGKLLTSDQSSQYSFSNVVQQSLGLDMTSYQGHRYVEKNGAEGVGNGNGITTSVAIMGGDSSTPGIVGVLFINSDITTEPGAGASAILLGAYTKALQPKP